MEKKIIKIGSLKRKSHQGKKKGHRHRGETTGRHREQAFISKSRREASKETRTVRN